MAVLKLSFIYTFLVATRYQKLSYYIFGALAIYISHAQDVTIIDIPDLFNIPDAAFNSDDDLVSGRHWYQSHVFGANLLIIAMRIVIIYVQVSVWRKSDHLECDLTKLGLSDVNLKRIDTIMSNDDFKKDELKRMSNNTGFVLSPHLVYRYLNSVDFNDNYHGQRWKKIS